MMKAVSILLAGAGLVFAGCRAPKVSWEKAQDLFDGHRAEKMNVMLYMGSDRADHYLFHSFLTMRKTICRIDKSELVIADEFPVTEDPAQWRRLEMPLRMDPAAFAPNINQGEPQRFARPATLRARAGGS